uniref:Tyrosine specific protein phosphatases domain-containing protein n=1 Tax=Micromonas pusilla TaxID=38833 RepID=A0A7S0IDT0_MICPS|mmetsp:Transcript_3366/g.13694  ORF Transcript_3366/g.13694 Transcript_3366/m.13694 type:complete len:990 (+) Transcript_3366:233-3202(+)
MSACARVMATRTVCGTYGVDRRSPRGDSRAGGRVVRATPAGLLGRSLAVSRGIGRAGRVSRATLDAEGIPWDTPETNKGKKGEANAPPGLSLEQFPGETLPELADRLEAAVEKAFGDRMYEECVVDMTPFGIEECYGDVASAVAEVVVAANAAETAGKFNMALRRKELRRLRAALWELRLTLEKHGPGSCTMSIRHRLEALRSASLDVCHPQMRAHDAPNATAIPNFQTVHLDFTVDALPDPFAERNGFFDGADALCRTEPPEVAFYRGGQPTAEGRAWMVSRGFKTIVDLRFEDRDNQWTRPLGGVEGKVGHVESQLEVVHIPVTDMEPPSFEAVERFIEIANDETMRPMLVHCKAGIGRTGSMVSCWRISRGMDVEEALALESLNCDFGSIAQEAFVRSFADRFTQKRKSAEEKKREEEDAWTAEREKVAERTRRERAETQLADVRKESEARLRKGGDPIHRVVEASASVDLSDDGESAFEQPAESESRTRGGSFYEGAGFHEDDLDNVSADRVLATSFGPEGTGSGGVRADEPVAIGEHSDLDQAPDMYVIRTDGFTCTREEIEERMLKISHPSTQQLVLVWRKPPKRIFILKKLGPALLQNLVEVAHAMLSMGFQVVVEASVLEEMRVEREHAREMNAANGSVRAPRDFAGTHDESEHAEEIREYVYSTCEALEVDEVTGRIPKEDWGTFDLIVCLGGDGVILHASKLFQGPVPPVLGFHLGSMGFLTNHPPERMAQSLLQSVGKGTKKVANVKGGIPITLRMRLECTLVKARDSERNGGGGEPSHTFTILNEVLVDRGPSPFLSKIEAYDRGQLITTIQADGVMLATATGSTAYSVSAGGSMVHPNVPAILMTPICPHTLSFRPVVLPDSVEVELRVADDARQSAWVSFDGKERAELMPGDSVFIRMSQFPVPTVNYADQTGDFISSLRRCLRWNERDEQKPLDEVAKRELRKLSEPRSISVDMSASQSYDADLDEVENPVKPR